MSSKVFTITTLLVLCLAGSVALLVRASERASKLSPCLDLLASWLRDRDAHQTKATMVMIGFDPGEYQNTPNIRVIDIGGVRKRSIVHGKAVAWMHSALPKSQIVCVTLPDDFESQRVVAAIYEALDLKPAAIYIPHSLLDTLNSDDAKMVSQVVARCWNAGSLPLTVIGPDIQAAGTPGVLTIQMQPDKGIPSKLCDVLFPTALVENSSLAEDIDTAVAAYVAVCMAATPAKEFGHLERTARIASTGLASNPTGSCRWFNLSGALSSKAPSVRFGEEEYAWSDSVGEVTQKRILVSEGAESERRVILAVKPTAKVRWLSAVSLLLDSSPILFVPTKVQATVVLQAADKEAASSAMLILNVHRGTDKKNGAYLFNAVSKEGL